MEKIAALQDFEDEGIKILPKMVSDYFQSGAGLGVTMRDNMRAFSRYRLKPRAMVDVSKLNTRTVLLEQEVSLPIGISPMAVLKMAHPEGETAIAKAAQKAGIVYVLSMYSTSSIEEVAEAAPSGINWFQLNILKDRTSTKDLIKRAEANSFKALVVTVDSPVYGRRLNDIRNNFTLQSHLKFANLQRYGEKLFKFDKGIKGSELAKKVAEPFDLSVTWKDLQWLKSITSLPIVVKGIMTPEDALLAIENGAKAIYVSNHGGRQLDTVPASVDVLQRIVQAIHMVDPKIEVFVDGGVRWGADVVKCLAMGAKAAFIGRPIVWSLAVAGKDGVSKALEVMKEDFEVALSLCGKNDVEAITKDVIYEL